MWLEQHHPEALPADRYKLTSAPSGGMPPGGSASSPSLSSSHPITPESSAKTTPPGGSASSPSLSSSQPITPESLAKTTPPSGSASSLSPSSSSSMCSSSGGQSSGKQNVISHFLPPLPTVTPSRSSTSKQGGARVLTSKDCLEQLAAKERKKQQKKEEKEKRKIEREKKKKEREEEQKRKADERAKKAAEKAKRDAEKALKAQEKATEKARKAAENKQQAGVSSRKKRAATSGSSQSTSLTTKPKAKTPCLDESIDTEECCACFGQYSDDIGTGREWLDCACGRWLHEDCVENIVYDTNGKEKLCPLCLSIV